MDKLGTVLVIDNDPVVRQDLTNILASRGFFVESFDSGVAVLNRLTGAVNGSSVGVAVMDLSLQDMSGQVLSQKINNMHRHIITVFTTKNTPPPIISGFRVFNKPVTEPEEFSNFIWQLMKTTAWSSKLHALKETIDGQAQNSADCKANVTKRLDEMGLFSVVNREWKASGKLAKAIIGIMGSAILTLGAIASYLGFWVFEDSRTKLKEVHHLQEKVTYQIEPAVKEIKSRQDLVIAGLGELLKRVPPGTTSVKISLPSTTTFPVNLHTPPSPNP